MRLHFAYLLVGGLALTAIGCEPQDADRDTTVIEDREPAGTEPTDQTTIERETTIEQETTAPDATGTGGTTDSGVQTDTGTGTAAPGTADTNTGAGQNP